MDPLQYMCSMRQDRGGSVQTAVRLLAINILVSSRNMKCTLPGSVSFHSQSFGSFHRSSGKVTGKMAMK